MAGRGPIRLGLMGCGAFGRFCLGCFAAMEEVRIEAVSRARRPEARELAARLGARVHAEHRLLLADPAVELVHVATPPNTHGELAVAAAEAGKHVLCEKPLALDLAAADAVVAAAGAAGVLAATNFVLRHNRITDAVKAIADSGVLGAALAGRVTNLAGDEGLGPDHWFWDRSVSGGIFVEHGVHFFDLYRHWLGPGEVVAARTEKRPGTDREDRVTCLVRHACGCLVSHYHSFDRPAPLARAGHRLVFELGEVRVDGWIPLSLTVEALVDTAGQEALGGLCPDADIEVVERLDGRGAVLVRGKPREVDRRIRLTWTPQADKQSVYADSVRALLADQIAAIRDPSHRRRVVESDGREAVALAQTAAQLAGRAGG